MLDMGFKPQVKQIFRQIRPTGRQVLMFSATWPVEVQDLAKEFFTNHTLRVTIGSLETSANHSVQQRFEFLGQSYEKGQKLKEIISSHPKDKILIFMKTKRSCNEMQVELENANVWVSALHGDMAQTDRDAVIRNFKDSR